MRRLLATGCCLAYLAFGVTAGTPHVHEAADHHEEMRGLHVGHTHLGETARHGQDDHHHGVPAEPADEDEKEEHLGTRHIGHHEGDALYLNVTAQRLVDSGPRVVPAETAGAATIDPPAIPAVRPNERPDPLRGPPRKSPTPPRAPPA